MKYSKLVMLKESRLTDGGRDSIGLCISDHIFSLVKRDEVALYGQPLCIDGRWRCGALFVLDGLVEFEPMGNTLNTIRMGRVDLDHTYTAH